MEEEMNKSVSACICGIIFSIIGAIASYVFCTIYLFLSLALASLSIVSFVPLINLAVYALALIGSIVCLFKAKPGGIIMIISAILSLICMVVICIALKVFNAGILICWIPALIILLIGTSAVKKHNKNKTK